MPNKYYSPYDFLTELQAAVRKKYDIEVIEVRYIVSIV
jgi:predicted transcriptional regulator